MISQPQKYSLFSLAVLIGSCVLTGCSAKPDASPADSGKASAPPTVVSKPEIAPTDKMVSEAPKPTDSPKPDTTVEPDSKKPAEAASSDVKSGTRQSGHEIEEAKLAMASLGNAKGLAALSDHLTNESAGAIATPMLLVVAMMSGFGQMAGNMASGQPGSADKVKKINDLSASTNAVMKKYGLDGKAPGNDDASIHKIELHGRALLKDLGGLMDKMGGDTQKSSSPFGNKKFNPDDVTYQVVSPTEVKLIPKKPEDMKDAPKDLAMKFEDGAWRLDFGGVKSVLKQMGTKGGGMPGSPGANPFAGGMPGGPGGGFGK